MTARVAADRTGPPEVKLGHQAPNGISAGLLALVERGASRRPRIARELRGRVEIRFYEDYAPVRLHFGDEHVLVEDGGARRWRPDLVIQGSLPHVVQLATAPLVGGMPSPTVKRGRTALASVASRRVRIEGSPLLARRLMKLLEV
ncbi:MAG: hypothetical protein ACRDL4_09990 [Thermoleophilaceae bacterium]